MSEFATTAPYYATYRPGIPAEAVSLLTEAVSAAPHPVLLDLGAGTGQVALALHQAVAEIDVVERDADMLAHAERALADLPVTVRLHHTSAEAFVPPSGWQADLVTICRAFHWMDQPAVLSLLETCTAPKAVVAVMGDGSLWTARSRWTDDLRALIQEYTGPDRRAGTGKTYDAHNRPYREVLAESAFDQVEEHALSLVRTWTPAEVIGYLYSTSFAARPLFGDRVDDFERRARALLTEHAATEGLTENAVFNVLLARRS
ncbi:class I SAM-dependent methyltransferase [Streptomyces sp. NPDC051561]|uniref:class I SAM-dependent methyltransferase n=1 Tax=Streptomyces sp. NPDC051561 TaxID=3365658 RepID=UPI0037A7B3F6